MSIPKIQYRFHKVDKGQRAALVKSCVLLPLTGKRCFNSDKDCLAALKMLQNQWRVLLTRLEHASLLTAAGVTESRYDAMFNCRVVLAHSLPEAHPCARVNFCPFCWGRRVRDYWAPVQKACKSAGEDGELYYRTFRNLVPITGDFHERRRRTVEVLMEERKRPADDLKKIHHWGMLTLTIMVPSVTCGLEVQHRQLLLLPRQIRLQERIAWTQTSVRDMANAQKLYTCLFRYPKALLACAPERLAPVLLGIKDAGGQLSRRTKAFLPSMEQQVS